MTCRPLPPVIAPSPLPFPRVEAECGKWLTFCGKGKHEVVYHLGETDGPTTIWYVRETPEDEVYVVQNGEVIAAAPLNDTEGSFTFQFAPTDRGNDDLVMLVHEGKKIGSRVRVRLDCPLNLCLPPVVIKPGLEDTYMKCGKHHHQSGFVRKNTVILGDDPGYVDVTWSVEGSALVLLYQGQSILKRMTPNRNGNFRFFYNADNGPVYAITQGIGTVDYIFGCPYMPDTTPVVDPSFTCGSGNFTFAAPQNVDVIMTTQKGASDITVTVEETTQITFLQGGNPFYVLSGHSGTVNFTLDYDPVDGDVSIQTAGYGDVTVNVKCPVKEPEPVPEDVRKQCGTAIETIPGFSNLTVHMESVNGPSVMDLILTGTPVTVKHAGIATVYENSGSYTIEVQGTQPFIVESRGNDYQIRVSCPVKQPINDSMTCGTVKSFDTPSNITIQYGNSPAGNSRIRTSKPVNIYRSGVLVGQGTDVTVFYPGSGTIVVESPTDTGGVTIDVTCPAIQTLNCGNNYVTFSGGDVVNVVFASPLIRGHVTMGVEIVGVGTKAVFWVGSTQIREVTTTQEFQQILRTQDGLRIVTSGTGQIKLKVTCAQPIYIVSEETKTRTAECPPGQTVGGVEGGRTTVTYTWKVQTWSDGSTTTTPEVADGVCQPVVPTLKKFRYGLAMFTRTDTWTGGPYPPTQAELDYGMDPNTNPEGIPYTHWTGLNDFLTKVMTNSNALLAGQNLDLDLTFTPGRFLYVMWDKRFSTGINVTDRENGFPTTFDSIAWRNDWFAPFEPSEPPAGTPTTLEVTWDDGTGSATYCIQRYEFVTTQAAGNKLRKLRISYK